MKHKIIAGLLALGVVAGTSPAFADEEVETEVTKSLLAEYGVNQDEVEKLNKDFTDAKSTYEETVSSVKRLEGQLEEVNQRLITADQELSTLKGRVVETEQKIEKSESEVGLLASTMYKNSGSPQGSLSAFLTVGDESSMGDKASAGYLMTRVMEQRSGTVENQKQLQVMQEADKLRQEFVHGEIDELKNGVQGLLGEAEKKRKEAEEQRKNYELLLTNAEEAATGAKARYEEAVTKAKKEAAAFKKQQEELLKAQKISLTAYKTSITNLENNALFPLPLPSEVSRVTSNFGFRPTPAGTIDYGGQGGYVHAGIDYGTPCGTPVYAVADGEVFLAGADGSAGNAVGLNHGIVGNFTLATRYHHLIRAEVQMGAKVKRGDLIGISGTTGNSTGCHLHFETIINGEKVNPTALLP